MIDNYSLIQSNSKSNMNPEQKDHYQSVLDSMTIKKPTHQEKLLRELARINNLCNTVYSNVNRKRDA